MNTINLSFAALFFVLAMAGFVFVVFYGAWWHIGTLIVCSIISALFYSEFKLRGGKILRKTRLALKSWFERIAKRMKSISFSAPTYSHK